MVSHPISSLSISGWREQTRAARPASNLIWVDDPYEIPYRRRSECGGERIPAAETTTARLRQSAAARGRTLGERGAATLENWHPLRKARCSPSRLTTIVKAILTLHHQAA
ncbi:hypothetical protein GCM10009780_41770 [Actinomadura alba]